MLKHLVLGLALIATPALAQDRVQTLADIKAELGALMGEFTALRAELVASGAAGGAVAGGDALQRMDAIEAELTRLTSKAEEIELRLNRVVADGTNRLGDLEFRLCEVTEGCDIANLPTTPPIGGDVAAATPATPAPAATGPELAMGEQADFDRAKAALDAGNAQEAATLFANFATAYPGGPLSQQAQYLRGEALAALGDSPGAARAYLDAFSSQPDGSFAPDSLLKLGQSLATLGQVADACVTLAEVGNRFPGSAQAGTAQGTMQGLACQ